jgi:hypothetical protein
MKNEMWYANINENFEVLLLKKSTIDSLTPESGWMQHLRKFSFPELFLTQEEAVSYIQCKLDIKIDNSNNVKRGLHGLKDEWV